MSSSRHKPQITENSCHTNRVDSAEKVHQELQEASRCINTMTARPEHQNCLHGRVATNKLNITTTFATGAKFDNIKTLSNAATCFGATNQGMLPVSWMLGSDCGYCLERKL
ncbi:hypothetical protein TNCV_4414421 [Trichonephila clavipes]|uniref:Uncharacterized protein n=1 Tax=Trichonephila clavipes TaxID=2585209 RepID=A0A8X6V9H9_TRICX|nr:hypothetical protein TNCV_4414421 [Trichonephila clavipes]